MANYGIHISLLLSSLEFVTGLLNNVGTHIDPTKLIQVSAICRPF